MLCGVFAPAHVFAGETPNLSTQVSTNEAYITAVGSAAALDIKDKKRIFQYVLEALPQKVTVYPTENYYYFSFYHRGLKYAGNFRLDTEDRDKGVVHFSYFKDFTPWHRDETSYEAVFGAKDGVDVKKQGPLMYTISSGKKSVTFSLIDLSAVVPPKAAKRDGEIYIGPVFDESGIRFFLFFNQDLKIFHYVLDETVRVADVLITSKTSDRISIGTRTGFAFYKDKYMDRQILIGVYALNTQVNNYLDGPFDQLPDNFLKGDSLKNAILAASPEMKGQIDRFGNAPDDKTRYLIAPYMLYDSEADLELIDDCAQNEKLPTYYACFSYTDSDQGEEQPPVR